MFLWLAASYNNWTFWIAWCCFVYKLQSMATQYSAVCKELLWKLTVLYLLYLEIFWA